MPTILVADDNSNIQKMVTLALQELGIQVIAVGNGEAAVRKLADITPDLVLADVFMPVRNGYEVCEYIKREARYSHIPVVLLIGAFDPLDEKEAHRVGANGILKKPFVPPDPLISMVTGFLAGAEKHKSANEPFPETARTAPPPVAQAVPPAPVKSNQKFPSTEIEPEEFAFTRGPLSLRDSSHEHDSNEGPAVAPEPEIEENKIAGSWEDRIKPQPPSPLEQQLEAVDSQTEKSAPWDDDAELKPSSTWQPQIPTNATSSWETAAEEWQAESLKAEVKIREGHASSSTEAPETMVEPEPILTEEITLPGQSITGEESKISVDAGPSRELAESPAEWMELMSGAPTISVPAEAAETWDVTPAAPTSGVNAPHLQASPSIESTRGNPPAKDHSVPLVVIPFHSNEEAPPQSSEPVSIEPSMAFRPDEEKNAAK
ncbi:MAG: response regulator, partial [Candidatus Acidiferrales bacterium]